MPFNFHHSPTCSTLRATATTSPIYTSANASFIYPSLSSASKRSTIFMLNIASINPLFTSNSPFSSTWSYAVPFMPNLLPSLSTFLSTSYKRSPISIPAYVSFIKSSLFSDSKRLITEMLNVAVTSSAKFILTRYSPLFESLLSHAQPVTPRLALSFKNFLTASYKRSPTKRSAYTFFM